MSPVTRAWVSATHSQPPRVGNPETDTCDLRPKVCTVVLLWLGTWGLYRNTPFCHASQIPWFLQIEGLQQPWVDQVSTIFPFFQQSLLTLCLCLWIFSLFVNIFNFYIVKLWWSMISDLWCHCYDTLKVQMTASKFLAVRYPLIEVWTLVFNF